MAPEPADLPKIRALIADQLASRSETTLDEVWFTVDASLGFQMAGKWLAAELEALGWSRPKAGGPWVPGAADA